MLCFLCFLTSFLRLNRKALKKVGQRVYVTKIKKPNRGKEMTLTPTLGRKRVEGYLG